MRSPGRFDDPSIPRYIESLVSGRLYKSGEEYLRKAMLDQSSRSLQAMDEAFSEDVPAEDLGRLVRDVWVAFAMERQARGEYVPPHHLIGWDDLDDENKDVDRRIGDAIQRRVKTGIMARYNALLAPIP